jgi:hypothetical protein
MAAEHEAWPQDDAGARAALLAWLDGELPLEDAAVAYTRCFPPAAGMTVDQIRQTWGGWNSAMRQRLAAQIRRGMEQASEEGSD